MKRQALLSNIMTTAHIIERANKNIFGEYDMRPGQALRAAWAYWQGNNARFVRNAGIQGASAVRDAFEKKEESDQVVIETTWLKGRDCASYKQINFLETLLSERELDWPWVSNSNGQRLLHKADASQAISALKGGASVVFA